MSWIRIVLNRLRTSLWLIPAVMATVGTVLGVAMLFSGLAFSIAPSDGHWWVFSGDAGTARDLLSTLLSGMITMTSLVVSITMVVLSLSAGQLGPRLIWNFIDDRQIQAVIGLFVATILYTLVVLRSINEELGPDYVPHAAITMASALVVVCLFALLFYLHKLARSIISDTMVDTVARHLSQAIATRSGERRASVGGPLPSGSLERRIALTDSGYVQFIDYAALCRLAVRHDALLTVRIRAGAFAIRGRCVIEALSPAPLPDDVEDAVRDAFALGADRTPDQDLEYAIRQLVEIALRALSPGINDPFTAITVIDRLAAALEEIGRRPLPPQEYADEDGTVRVIADASTYEALVNTAFMQIRQSARDDAAVLLRLASRLRDLHEVASSDVQRDALSKHLHMIGRLAEGFAEPADRRALEEAAAVPPENASVTLPLR
ncbi:DUF2254 domain-containing protein [Rhodoplanes sp. TEM]|uniref:DUF2254 domain-containing protein n=1 Tax=Rhodoplanes tepidamans TaxID=200616 RepID=A0ABT5J6A8_RHOTP|nr:MULTISPECIES: DUF2254 domain-containing protein [Rhodoplanes]MDC7785058.1 DUF2254 domain-containing protein [Rhodoplanes tepidamans]MDC7982532.1 DUF2254 domain-containing protein [Rhodoplanes sp. TEM]MDQ0356546.1 putative membrane protein [Rhodoplanes tepidamans]